MRFHEEEDGLIAVIADNERLILRDSRCVRIERMVRQYPAVHHRPETARSSTAPDTTASSTHRQRTAPGLFPQIYLDGQKPFCRHVEQFAPLIFAEPELLHDHQGGFCCHISWK